MRRTVQVRTDRQRPGSSGEWLDQLRDICAERIEYGYELDRIGYIPGADPHGWYLDGLTPFAGYLMLRRYMRACAAAEVASADASGLPARERRDAANLAWQAEVFGVNPRWATQASLRRMAAGVR